MKDIIKKILIISSAFVLVLSFSFSHWNTSKRYQVQASEFSMTLQVANAIAVFLAGLGIKMTSDLSFDNFQAIYNGLPEESRGILSSPTLGNNIVEGMWALTVDQVQTLAKAFITTMGLDTMPTNTNSYTIDGLTVPYDVISLNNFTAVSTTALTNLNFTSQSNVKRYVINYEVDFLSITCVASNMCDYYAYDRTFTDFSYLYSVPYRNADGNVYTLIITDAINYPSKFIHSTKATIDGWLHWFASYNATWAMGFATGANMVSTGLTLPAPFGGWRDSDAGDIDVSDWSKQLENNAGLPLVVLGGLTATGLEDLKNMGPNDVLLDDGIKTPFDTPKVVVPDTGAGTIDGTVDFPNTDSIPETNSGLAGWIGGALGALTGGLFGALNGILGWIKGIWEWLKQMAGSLSSILSLLLTLPMILYEAITGALSNLFTWDLDLTRQKFEGLRTAMMFRIPCMNETIQAWYDIIATNGHNLTSSFTFFGETFSWNSGQLLQAFAGFAASIKQAFRFVFWFVFLKGMRRRVTAFLGSMSVER